MESEVDHDQEIATDGAGNWVAVWHRLSSGGTLGTDTDLLVARSIDNGATWTNPTPLNTNAATDSGNDDDPTLATDGAGNWVVAWRSTENLGGAIGTDADILVARSTDNGATWTDPVPLNNNAATDSGTDRTGKVTTDGAGTWLAVWDSEDELGSLMIGNDRDILVARSTDDGATWTDPVPLNNNAPTDSGIDRSGDVTTDGAGTWLAVWDSTDDLGTTIGTDLDILVARSTDDGATWTDPAPLNNNAPTDSGDDGRPRLATDRAGNWVAVWFSDENLGGTLGPDLDVFVARSIDNGATWTAPAPLNANAATDSGAEEAGEIATDEAGNWVAAWTSDENPGGTLGFDLDVFVARSIDNGATWTAPAPLNTNAATDSGADQDAQLATDGAAKWVAVWDSADDLGVTIGNDRDILVARFILGICGDGFVDPPEQCDDGNTVPGDGCDANCQLEPTPTPTATPCVCGDGVLCVTEECDDGNTSNGDGCSAGCTCDGMCGDGIQNPVPACGEECDEGANNCPPARCCASGCSSNCKLVSRCTGNQACCVSVAECPPGEGCCGDGVLDPGEQCDDGNVVRGDGCNELCQVECTPAAPVPTPTPLSSDEVKCQRTINKETSKFVKAKTKALQKCTEAIIKNKTADPGVGLRVNFCLTDPADAFAVKAQFKIDRAASKIGAKIAKVCGGDDRVCGTFDNDEATPDAIGFHGTCPGFEGRGNCAGGSNSRAICAVDSDCPGGTCATCDDPIADCADIAACVACIGEAAVDQAIVLYYDGLADEPAGDLQKCQTTIGKEATKYLQQKEKNLQKCWDRALKGKHTDRCPDFAAPVDSTAHKAAEKIARAESKMISKICRKCGGADRQCDDPVRVVNPLTPPFPGSGGSDDPHPTSAIGFPATCDAVTVPGGPACGIGVNTVADLVSCVSCVTEFKVDCIDAARMPELQGRVYPCECNP